MRARPTAVARGLAIAMLAVSAVPAIAQRQSPLDVPVEGTLTLIEPRMNGECTFWWATLAEFAEKVHVRVGFETPPQCRITIGREGARMTSPRIAFEGLTPREALDRLLETQPGFAWQDVDGVVVIRPIAAWKQPEHVLQARVAPFAVAGVHPHDALHAMLQSAQPSLLLPHTDLLLSSLGRRIFDPGATGLIDEPVDVRFSGGSLLQALNALVGPFDGIWYVGYAGTTMNIVLGPPDFSEGVTSIQVRVSNTGTAR
jgi:hypothetical protein